MVVGDKWEVYAPSELAYGDDGMEEAAGRVAPGEAVVYVLELLSMDGAGVPRKPPPRNGVAEAAEAAEAGGAAGAGLGALRRLRDGHDLRSWVEEAGEQRTLVLALLRAPSSCMLRRAVAAAAARAHGPGSRAAFAFSAESAFLPSALERTLGLAAPAVTQQGQARRPGSGTAGHLCGSSHPSHLCSAPSLWTPDPDPDPYPNPSQAESLLAWTTTPWTLPSNLALCVNATMMCAQPQPQP